MGNPLVRDDAVITRARVTFTEFRSPDDPMLLAWARFRGVLAAGLTAALPVPRAAPAGKRDSGLWRLLATNNRELARSFLLYTRFEAAHAHVEELQANHGTLRIVHLSGASSGSRGWLITAADVPVMTCSRWYGSLSTAAAAAEGALEAFRGAVPADAPDRSDASGRFRRRTPVGADVRPT
ncbi:hypothetical protein [Microbacterium allomyrinae]|uniref:Uncharacterized protein n=1 Tax=Microbacterium allomyrinae TaxID=2830666 RepID=A0A9X1LVK8_9MICO|nr:hypothetical protein [Microbacterium allomyrinae]MCC2032596.1 hypothetical protein [Microbacterium allomyrinae]